MTNFYDCHTHNVFIAIVIIVYEFKEKLCMKQKWAGGIFLAHF